MSINSTKNNNTVAGGGLGAGIINHNETSSLNYPHTRSASTISETNESNATVSKITISIILAG